ncbi:cysteine desulfurase / selenocysteine lyase [Alteromonadaceae bacterium Bs31]|nr:cysteine desulfurase / selenocysteine lyase [Alteromonadaceae bacterium Bs31]
MSAELASTAKSVREFDVEKVRSDFPILQQQINGHPLVYLDNAASTQKPNSVIDAISNYYRTINSNVHRGAHHLSDMATEAFEGARQTVSEFLNSPKKEQILWVRGTTEAVNLVAHSWGRHNINAGDKILVSTMEHHSNIVPWQILAEEKGASVVPIPITAKGEIDLHALEGMLDHSVKLVSVNQVSNALGTVNPVADIVQLAKKVGAKSFVDGAQAVAHFPVDLVSLGCDFYAFSAHKLFGPTGIGVLWGKEELLDSMPPYHGGGEMIETCSFACTTYNKLPYKFEAGTPDIAGAIGLAAAIDYVQSFDRAQISQHENTLLSYCHELAAHCDGLSRVGEAENIAGVFSFLLKGAHPSDVGMLLDQQGVAVRTGHHCAQPLMDALNIPGTVRASFSIYNTKEDIDRLFAALDKVKQFL